MDGTPQKLADTLGTTRTRVIRAAQRLGLGSQTPGGHWKFSVADAARLRAILGRETTKPAGALSRVELRVLAALQRAPRGSLSARAVARRAAVSPTSASAALDRLRGVGLVTRTPVTVAEGTAHTAELWRINYRDQRWPELAEALATTEAPRPQPIPASGVPRRFAHLFWNVDLSRVDIDRDATYIARRLLDADDLDALAWGSQHLPTAAWAQVRTQRGLTAARRALADNLAGAATP